MRILSPHCGVDAETTSGGAVFERELLRRLAEKHDVHILTTRRARDRAPTAPWTIHATHATHGLTWWTAPFMLLDRMRDLPRPDLLRVHSLRIIGPSALYARRVFWPGVPIVAHHHHLDGRRNPIERFVSDRMDRVIVGSEFAKRQMRERGWRTDHVRVVPYAVDERFQPVDRSGRVNVIVLFLGGLKKRKNVDLLLRIWPEVARACPNAILRIAGDGPERAKLERMARGMPRVSFAGYVAEKQKPQVYQDADVFAFPSHMEGFGLPALEAMASGLPVLVSANGSLPELVEVSSVCRSDGEMWHKLAWLCERGDVRRRKGESARHISEGYSWERCVRETEAVYEEVLR